MNAVIMLVRIIADQAWTERMPIWRKPVEVLATGDLIHAQLIQDIGVVKSLINDKISSYSDRIVWVVDLDGLTIPILATKGNQRQW